MLSFWIRPDSLQKTGRALSLLTIGMSLISTAHAVTNEELGKLLLADKHQAVTQNYLDYYAKAPIGNGQIGPGYHPGIDYRAAIGLKVYSPLDGTITRVDLADAKTGKLNSFGTVTIKANNSEKRVILLHLATSLVRVGDSVTMGCVIGTSGQTGTDAPHLHIEVRNNRDGGAFYFSSKTNTGVNENPATYFPFYSKPSGHSCK